jgi:sugar lactone lactonase YvrE
VYDATILDDRDPNSEVSTIVGMGMDPNGTSLYVTGFYNGGYLFWYGVDGVLKGVWPTSNFGDGTPGLSSGSRVAVGPDGSVYVIERGTRSVRKFTTSLTPATSWGGAGTASGKFRFDGNDDGIACDRQGRVYVVDGKNHRVQVFDADGQFLAKFGTAGSKGLGRFVTPTGIAVARNGRVYVVDAGRCNVQVFVPR